MSLKNLAELLRVQGKYDGALLLFQRALAIVKKQLQGPESMAPKRTATDSDSDQCPICLEVLDAATAVLLNCKHVLCAKCQEDRSRRLSSRQKRAGGITECPMCRKRAKLTEIAS